jgi:transcriptional antiterminator NusG
VGSTDTNNKRWYIVHTYSGYEEKVKRSLEQRVKFMDAGDKIFQVVIPTEDEIEIRGGQRTTDISGLCPGTNEYG